MNNTTFRQPIFRKFPQLVFFALCYLLKNVASAQLAPNSIAQNFTVSAYQPWLSSAGMYSNGSYTLYDYLDQGYTVIVDFSTTWCGTCWVYHSAGVLDSLYAAHGPAGYPGVNANTTDDVMVLLIESDNDTGEDDLLGTGPLTLGNWIEPTPGHQVQFPVADPIGDQVDQLLTDYSVNYFSTVYKICPNRRVIEVGPVVTSELYDAVEQCEVASDPVDVSVESYDVSAEYCASSYSPKITIQNFGTTPLTEATVSVLVNGEEVSTGSFSGNLDTYGFATITCSEFVPFDGTLTLEVDVPGDVNVENNSLVRAIYEAPVAIYSNATVKVTTDFLGSSLTWEITNSAGEVVLAGGPYEDEFSPSNVQPDVNFEILPNECYWVKLHDAQFNGFDGFSGDGSFKILQGGIELIDISIWGTADTSRSFASNEVTVGLAENSIDFEEISIYPIPATDYFNIEFIGDGNDCFITLLDISGRRVAEKTLLNALGKNRVSFPTVNLESGNYVVKIENSRESTSRLIQIMK